MLPQDSSNHSPISYSQCEQQLKQIIGSDGGLAEIVENMKRVLGLPINILIQGESGTGKEVIARAIHDCDPLRRKHPFVAINAATIPENLVEAELFGCDKGAFTGAAQTRDGYFQKAHAGTLFLDEIGELPLVLQPKFLRVLQEKTVCRLGGIRERPIDVRVVSATQKDLRQAMGAGFFRTDLYYRFAEYIIDLPPLRQRRQDIGPLARYFLRQYCKEFHKPDIRRLSDEALAWLEAQDWAENNVRELSLTLRRAVIFCDNTEITPDNLALPEPQNRISHRKHLQEFERQHLERTLNQTRGNIAAAARLLGLSRSTLYDRLKKLDIQRGSSWEK